MAHKSRDTGALKRDRIQKMHTMLQGTGDVELSRFTAAIEYQMGLTPKKVMEYLDVLVRLDLVEVDEVANLVREKVPEVVEE